jgi:hypothetical protein
MRVRLPHAAGRLVWAVVVVLLVVTHVSLRAQATLASYTVTTNGWATFGLALPQGAARSAVQLGTLPTQTDVKVRWTDGSIRFAVVSANVSKSGVYPIASASRPAGAVFSPRRPSASVALTIGGTRYVATLPGGPTNLWLAGPLVTESRAIVAPGGHPFLRVIFDVRSYADAGHRVDVTVENGLDVAAADQVTYDVAITIGGATVFQQAAVTHKYLARWRRTFTAGGLREAAVMPDLAPFIAAHALPAFAASVAGPARTIDAPRYGILGFGDLTLPMDAHGGRAELAPYPDWTAQYLVHKSPAQRAYVLRHGELAGSWGIHLKEPDGATMISIDRHPTYWLDDQRARWVENGFEGPKNGLKGMAQPGDNAHQPSLAYVPYLITGDRFFADETSYWAHACLIGTFAAKWARNGSQGLLTYNEVRGIGWALRNLGDAAAYLPDADPAKPYLASKVLTNLNELQTYATTFSSGAVKTLFPGRRPEDFGDAHLMWISLWEQSYLAWAVDHVMQHGDVTAHHNFSYAGAALRDRIVTLALGLFTNPQWPRDHMKQMPYLLAAGRWIGQPQYEGSRIEYFQTFAEMATHTFSLVDSTGAPSMLRPFEGFYGPEARLLLMIAERLGLPGATDAINALMKDTGNGTTMIADLNVRSGWAIARGNEGGIGTEHARAGGGQVTPTRQAPVKTTTRPKGHR